MKLEKSVKTVPKTVKKKTTAPVASAKAEKLETAAKPRSVTPKPTSAAKTTIEANIDVGFGNHLFVRGQGAGLSWEHGTPLTCVDGKTWRWSANAAETMTFKLILNDQVWAQGADLVAKPGDRVAIQPAF